MTGKFEPVPRGAVALVGPVWPLSVRANTGLVERARGIVPACSLGTVYVARGLLPAGGLRDPLATIGFTGTETTVVLVV
jgi:hypothetical protein